LFHKDQTDNMGLKLPNIIVNEAPAWSVQNLQGRAFSEKRWNADDQITVHVTVHGWLRPSGGLWVRGQDVIVDSPMLIMPNEKLILKSATYTQDNKSGTRTTLDLRNEKAIGQSQPSL
jgi:prophage tail gpP-like protein